MFTHRSVLLFLHIKEIHLAAVRHISESAKRFELLKIRLADLGTGHADFLNGYKLLAGIAAALKVQCRCLAKAGYGHERRAQVLIVNDHKLGRI